MNRCGCPKASQRVLWLASSLVLGGFILVAGPVRAADADLVPTDVPHTAPDLNEKGKRQADALAYFMSGIFEEESAGPEKALESKRKVLDLDPGCSELAIEVAYEYLRRGETAEATNVLKDAIAAKRKVVAPYLALSTIYLRHLQKPELAARYAQQAIDIAPDNADGYELLWETYQSQGMSAKAQLVLDRAAKSKSTDPDFWLSLAEMTARGAVRDNVPPDGATVAQMNRFLDQAASLGGEKFDVAAKLGDLYAVSRQTEKAIPYYKRVIELRSESLATREKLARCYLDVGQVDPAIEQFEAIVAANPLSLDTYVTLSELYVKNGDLSKALVNARQAVVIEPGNIDRYSIVVDLLYRMKRYDEMAATLAEARRNFPRVARITHLYAVSLSQAGKHDQAVKAFADAEKEAENSQPDLLDARFYFDYGGAAERAGQHDLAAAMLKKSIDLDPANAGEAYNYLGYMWADQGKNLDEAELLIRRALAMEPSNGAYIDSLGWLYYHQGKYQEALTELLRAAEALPEPDPTVYGHVADAYHKLGKTAEAVLYWQKALALDPENKEFIAKLDEASKKVAEQPEKKPVGH
ncbi:Chs5p-Arf1p-binding protein [Terrimicrobium sacchariphilum]|uniref:Chs5p-Arf1p-binding protein n=1 Tax=Terrimicrobium sacchariphilum TaxID=690879 RepID=A0A146GD17_TERSA|nr:tetratricopeptide repeat protein [Terrimicrobium sacchariphilum]GAT35063.1 Chs5p-Arf1p-binding protein [Terrimicrobium sacchariphilum]